MKFMPSKDSNVPIDDPQSRLSDVSHDHKDSAQLMSSDGSAVLKDDSKPILTEGSRYPEVDAS